MPKKTVVVVPVFPDTLGTSYVMACPPTGAWSYDFATFYDHPDTVLLGYPEYPSSWQEITIGGLPTNYWQYNATDGNKRGIIIGQRLIPGVGSGPRQNIASTADGGLTWTVRADDGTPILPSGTADLYFIQYMDDGRFGAISSEGDIVLISNDGATITVHSPTVPKTIRNRGRASIAATPDGSVVMAHIQADSGDDLMSVSTDGGATFPSWAATTGLKMYSNACWYRSGVWHSFGVDNRYSSDNGATWNAYGTWPGVGTTQSLDIVPDPDTDNYPDSFIVETADYEVVRYVDTASIALLGTQPDVLSRDHAYALRHADDYGFLLCGGLAEWGKAPASDPTPPWTELIHPDQLPRVQDAGFFRSTDADFLALLQLAV